MRKIWINAVCSLALLLGATQLQAQPLVPGPTLELSEIFGSFPRQVELGDANGDGESSREDRVGQNRRLGGPGKV